LRIKKTLGCIKITELRIRNIKWGVKWQDHKSGNKVDTVIYTVVNNKRNE